VGEDKILVLPEQADGAVVPLDVESLVALVDAFDKFKSMVLKESDFWVDTRHVKSTQNPKKKPKTKKPKEKKVPEEPLVDPDEERVKKTLAANDIPMDDFTIYKWLNKIRIVPKPEFPQENFEAYSDALTDLLKADWVAKEGCWEIPC